MLLVLLGIVGLGVGAAYWYHWRVAKDRVSGASTAGAEAEDVHINLVFVFSYSPMSIILGVGALWLLCVAASFLWMNFRR